MVCNRTECWPGWLVSGGSGRIVDTLHAYSDVYSLGRCVNGSHLFLQHFQAESQKHTISRDGTFGLQPQFTQPPASTAFAGTWCGTAQQMMRHMDKPSGHIFDRYKGSLL
eukprot:365403-Chlamydomonas_euryale.AAC.6